MSTTVNSDNTRTLRILLGVIGALAAVIAIWWIGARDRPVDVRQSATSRTAAQSSERTIADIWVREPSQPQVVTQPSQPLPQDAPVDAAGIRDALRDVRVDEDGNVIVDHRALAALQEGFASLGQLDASQLASVQEIIRSGLPPPAGDQAATIVGNYYQYQLAARTMNDSATGSDLDASQTQLDRLVALRHSYFGAETAEKLFGDEQAYSRFMLASMRIESDASLSPPEKQQRQSELVETLPERLVREAPSGPAETTPDSTPSTDRGDWASRYAEFERQKQAILQAGLTEEEKNTQVDRLLHEHFASDEIESALRYESDKDPERANR
jgi:lipase chaperone LimK